MQSEIFSVRRLELLRNFYSPAIRRHALWGGLLLMLAYVLSWFTLNAITDPESDDLLVGLYSLIQVLPAIIYVSSPLVFAYCRQRVVATTLPASWVEKGVFMFGYCVVVFPLFMAAVWYSCTGLFAIFAPWADIQSRTLEVFGSVLPKLDFNALSYQSTLAGWLGSAWFVAVTCYFISAVRRQRLAIGIASIFGAYVVTLFSGIVVGVVAVFRSGFIAAIKAEEIDPENPTEFVSRLLAEITDIMPYYTGVCIALFVLFVVLTFRKIKTRQG